MFKKNKSYMNPMPTTDVFGEQGDWSVHYGFQQNSGFISKDRALKLAKEFNAPFIWKARGKFLGRKIWNWKFSLKQWKALHSKARSYHLAKTLVSTPRIEPLPFN